MIESFLCVAVAQRVIFGPDSRTGEWKIKKAFKRRAAKTFKVVLAANVFEVYCNLMTILRVVNLTKKEILHTMHGEVDHRDEKGNADGSQRVLPSAGVERDNFPDGRRCA